MGWKDWPYWVKGGIIFAFIGLFVLCYFVFFEKIPGISVPCPWESQPGESPSSIEIFCDKLPRSIDGWLQWEYYPFKAFLIRFIFIIVFVMVGLLIGWIYGKIKAKK